MNSLSGLRTRPVTENDKVNKEPHMNSLSGLRTRPVNSNDYNMPQPQGVEQSEQQDEGYTFKQRAMQAARGITNTYAGVNDIVNKTVGYYGAAGAEKVLGKLGFENAAEKAKQQKEKWGESDTLQQSQEFWNKQAGKDLEPKDTFGRTLEFGGEFFAPVTLGVGAFNRGAKAFAASGKGIKGAKEAAKNVGESGIKHLAASTGAGTALALQEERGLFEKGSFADSLDKMLEGTFGALAPQMLEGKSGVLKAIGQAIIRSEEKADKLGMLEKTVANRLGKGLHNRIKKGIETPEYIEELTKIAKKEGIDLPFNIAVGGQGKVANLIANNWFKSMFTSDMYNNVLKNADKGVVDRLKNILETTHPELLSRSEVSDKAKSFVKDEVINLKSAEKEMYKNANEKLKAGEMVSAEPALAVFDKILADAPLSPSKDKAAVYHSILDFYKKIGILPEKEFEKTISELGNFANGTTAELPNNIADQIRAFAKNDRKQKMIPAIEIEKQRKDFNSRYDPEKKDFSKVYGILAHGLKESLKTSKNKEYLKALFAADEFHQLQIATRVKNDITLSILSEQAPKETFSYMNSAHNVKEVEKILGDSPKAKEITQSLKRAKLEELIFETVVDGKTAVTENGNIKYGALANNILTHKNEDLLKALLRPEEYKQLQRLAKISNAFSKGGKAFGTNMSGTAPAASDIRNLSKFFEEGLKTLTAAIGGSVLGPLGSMATAGSYMGGINQLSKILSNPKVTTAAIEFAKKMQIDDRNGATKIIDKFYDLYEKNPKLSNKASLIEEINQEERKQKEKNMESSQKANYT